MKTRYLAISTAAITLGAQAASPTPGDLTLTVRSTRPEAVTGGDVRVLVAAAGKPVPATITVDGVAQRDLRPDVDGSVVVTGLKPGRNILRASAPGHAAASVTVINHPRSGPVFSGPHLSPWICAGAEPAADSAAPAPASMSATCDQPTSYRLYYRTTAATCSNSLDAADACFRPYDPARRPADLATTTTDRGERMNYVVRVERGALNRGMYDLAVLYRPGADEAAALGGWNRKMVWQFGGSSGNFRKQLPPATSWVNDEALRRGFLVGVSNFTDGSLNNNRILAAEMLMMAREHVSDTYGAVRYLIGEGCSAGSMQQNVIASGYPGLLDGVLVACTYPDSQVVMEEIADSVLLHRYFQSVAFKALSAGQSEAEIERRKAAIAGHVDGGSVRAYGRFSPIRSSGKRSDKPFDNGCGFPNAWVFDPDTNPRGVRCSTPDFLDNLYGQAADGGANLTRDNVGVQYGLMAFRKGAIGAEEFVTVNERIGGMDALSNFVPQRMAGARQAIAADYRAGMSSDANVLSQVPIIDLRGTDNSGVHGNWSSFALRARLLKANGTLDNFAMWRTGLTGSGAPWTNAAWNATGLPAESLSVMDAWLTGIEADKAAGTRAEKIARNRPAGLRSFCLLGTDYRTRVYDEARCDADPALKYYASIRQTAGQSDTADVLKCQLRPIRRADYPASLSDAQYARLRKVFASGVCDWSRPGVEQQRAVPWLRYTGGGKSEPMGAR